MNWFAKALAFKAFSSIPGGNSFYRYLQTNWTKSIVATPARVGQKIDIGMRYLACLDKHGYTIEDIRKMRHLDLGCGWHPTIPILYSKMGLKGQVLTDLNYLIGTQTFRESLEFVNQLTADPEHPAHALLQESACQPPPANASLDELLAEAGMEYHAPYFEWARTAGPCIDLATCTQVLMHVERPILDDCFKIIFDLLTSGGIFMSTVHLFDIYSNSDPNITIYNHVRYSKSTWSNWVNSDMMPFNRYKARDYREALEGAGFEIVEFDIDHGTAEDLRALRSLKVHPEFGARYTEEELADKHLFFVARKP